VPEVSVIGGRHYSLLADASAAAAVIGTNLRSMSDDSE
jgi:hypothetical protein